VKHTNRSGKQFLDGRIRTWHVREARRNGDFRELIAKRRAESRHLLAGCSSGQADMKFIEIETRAPPE
jgi:hypothetical protein